MGMDAIRQESRSDATRHPLANTPATPRSRIHVHGEPELLLFRSAPDADVLGAMIALGRLANLRSRTRSFHVAANGIARHSTGPETVTTIRVDDRRLEVVVHESDVATRRVVIPWTLPQTVLPLDRATAMRVVAAHARAAVPLLQRSLRAGPLPIEHVEHEVRSNASLVASCVHHAADGDRMRLPSPWEPPSIIGLLPSDPSAGTGLGDAGTALAAHLLPRVHAVRRDVDNPFLPAATTLGPVDVGIEPVDATEAMRRLGAILPHGGRPVSARVRADLLRRIGAAS